MSYRKIKNILICTLAALGVLTVGVACSNEGASVGDGGLGEEYIYNTDQPFYSQADAFMTLDGKFDEEQWQDCKWLECNRADTDTKLRMTTKFTQAGIYVGAIAYNKNIVWEGKHNYPSNSNFYVQIAKGDEKHYGSYPIYNHPMRDVNFYADAKNSLSLREVQYACATYCDGELNSGNTTSLSMELFVSWEDMHYSSDELGMDGMPETVRMWIKYSHPGKGLYAGFMDQGAYQTYYSFNKNGVVVDYNSKYLGHAIDGEAAFGEWVVDDENKKAYSTTTKTQTIWFKQDDDGNVKSMAKNYVAQVTVKGVEGQTGQYAGLISMQSKTDFSFYAVNVPEMQGGKVRVRTGCAMDGSGWMSSLRMEKKPVASGYNQDGVKLTVIKKGADFYYFCNGNYIGTDYQEIISGNNVVGFYANGAAEFSDWSFKDYTNDEQGIQEILSQYLWFVTFEQQGVGSLYTDRLAIPKQEGTVDITAAPNSGYVLTDLLCNGVSVYEDYLENVQDFKYRYQTDEDLKVKAVFTKLEKGVTQAVSFKFKNDKGETLSINPTIWLLNENKALNTWLQANSSGVVNADILKANHEPYSIGDKQVFCDGNYTLKIFADGYHDKQFSFTLDNQTNEYIIELVPVDWGSVTLNGEKTVTSGTVNLYDKATGIYGLQTNSTVKQYYVDTKTSQDYVVNATVTSTERGVGNVVGIMLSAGGNAYMSLKSCSWETNNLCLEVYDKNGTKGEVNISGFKHTLGVQQGDVALAFSVVRMGDTIYVCNENKELVFYLDKGGVHVQGSYNFVRTTELKQVNTGLAQFFEKGRENAVGLVQYYEKGGEYYFDVQTQIGEQSVLAFFEPVDFTLETSSNYQANVSGSMQISEKYAKNTSVTVVATSKVSGKVVKAMQLLYQDGSEKIIVGNYDEITGKTTFTFFIQGDCTAQLLLGDKNKAVGSVTLNGLSAYQIGNAIYDQTNDCYGVDSSATTYAYYVGSKTDGDFAFTSTVTVAEKKGFGHILGTAISAGGYAYIGFTACSAEANQLVLDVRDNSNTAKQVIISGFNHTLGGVGGTITVTVVKLNNVFYVYNANGVLAFTLDRENGLQLQDGFTTKTSGEVVRQFNEKLTEFYSLGDENAIGFVSWRYGDGTGKYFFEETIAIGLEQIQAKFDKVCMLTFAQSSEYQVHGLNTVENMKAFAKGATVCVVVKSLAADKKAKTLEIAYENGEMVSVSGEYDQQENTTTFTFVIEDGGEITVTLDDAQSIISGPGFVLGKDKDWAENPWLN